jgi:hypothetical protein
MPRAIEHKRNSDGRFYCILIALSVQTAREYRKNRVGKIERQVDQLVEIKIYIILFSGLLGKCSIATPCALGA